MCTYKYDNDDSFARMPNRSKNCPCYRTIISHALFNYHKKNNQNTKDVFNKFFQSYLNQQPYREETFLELYTVNEFDSSQGLLIIDKSNGYCPLFIRASQKSTSQASRKDALSNVIPDLENNIDNIIDKFNKYSTWNNELQQELQDIFTYPEEENYS